jgi:hypothetical protein
VPQQLCTSPRGRQQSCLREKMLQTRGWGSVAAQGRPNGPWHTSTHTESSNVSARVAISQERKVFIGGWSVAPGVPRCHSSQPIRARGHCGELGSPRAADRFAHLATCGMAAMCVEAAAALRRRKSRWRHARPKTGHLHQRRLPNAPRSRVGPSGCVSTRTVTCPPTTPSSSSRSCTLAPTASARPSAAAGADSSNCRISSTFRK